MRVYLDSAPIIYLVEDVAPYVSQLEARLASLDTYLLPTSPQRERDAVNYRSNVLLNMGE